jgi:hypothetical protein
MISASIVPRGPDVIAPESGEFLMAECPTQVATSTTGSANNTIEYASKLLVPVRTAFDRAGLYLATQQAGAQAWIAIYEWNRGKRTGGKLLADFGLLDLSTGQGAAVLSAALAVTLNAGPYWAVTWVKAATTLPTLMSTSASGASGTMPWATAVGAQPSRKLSLTGATFPVTAAPASMVDTLAPTAGAMPIPLLRAA